MFRKTLLTAFSLLTFTHVFAANTPDRVIYVTMDGVRWQDVFNTEKYFPKLWAKHANQLTAYGQPNTQRVMEVASIPVSLPSYQSQMSGSVQPCDNNDCGRIHAKTLPEALISQYHFSKKDVAVFSSWPVISGAIESTPDTVYSNVGNLPVTDPVTNQADKIMTALNNEQSHDFPSYKPNRFDKYTFAQAMHYLEKYQPRFLWISMVNADDEAHLKHRKNYHQMLSFYDDALDGLFTTLKAKHLDKNTLVIITTDHGRGDNTNWTTHGKDYPESKRTFAFVMNGELVPARKEGDVYYYNTLSIRPTMEKVLIGT